MIDVEMLRPTADEMLSGLSADEAMKRRMLFQARAIDGIPEIATEMMGGLQATPALRHRILVKADRIQRARQQSAPAATRDRKPALLRYAPVLSMGLLLTLMIGLGINHAADPLANLSPTGAPVAQTDLPSYSAGNEVAEGAVPQFRSLFAGEGANPPLIAVHGRYYRMLTVPVPDGVIGTPIAEVQDFTDEPALAATVGVVSNIAKVGTQVYSVEGIDNKTACIAEVDGSPRLFQRVGYASATFLGNEMFEDTFDVYGKVAALELSGVGVITDEYKANNLIYTLNEFAVYNGSDVPEGEQALTVYLDNGLSLQLMVQDDVFGGCGAWVCPEFFEAFSDAMNGEVLF